MRDETESARHAGAASGAPAWCTIRLADDDRNDVGAFLIDLDSRIAMDPGADVMALLGDDGRIYSIDLSTRPDTRNASPAARPNSPNATTLSTAGASARIQAIINSGIAEMIGPGRTVRALIAWPTVSHRGTEGTPRIVAIGPVAIVEHTHEMAVARACGIDVAHARRWIRSLTTWPNDHSRSPRSRSPDPRMSATPARIAGVTGEIVRLSLSTSVGRRLGLSEGCVILTDQHIPETVALHARGRPLREIVDIEMLSHLPLIAHAIHSTSGGTVIDYAPVDEEIDITYGHGVDTPHDEDAPPGEDAGSAT